jgi:hypothetical protein
MDTLIVPTEEVFLSYLRTMGHKQAIAQKAEFRLCYCIKAHTTRSQKLEKMSKKKMQ